MSKANWVIENKYKKLNFTITFNPYKFSDVDTLIEGPPQFEELVKLALRKSKWKGCAVCFWYVKEKHKNQRVHLHGQISLEPCIYKDFRFDIFDMLNGLLRKKLGICVLKWDKPEPDNSKEYPTYLDYCLKEADYITTVFQEERNFISTKIFKEKQKQNH